MDLIEDLFLPVFEVVSQNTSLVLKPSKQSKKESISQKTAKKVDKR